MTEVEGTLRSQSSTFAGRYVKVRSGEDGMTVLTIHLPEDDTDVSAIVSTRQLSRLLRAGEVVITRDETT